MTFSSPFSWIRMRALFSKEDVFSPFGGRCLEEYTSCIKQVVVDPWQFSCNGPNTIQPSYTPSRKNHMWESRLQLWQNVPCPVSSKSCRIYCPYTSRQMDEVYSWGNIRLNFQLCALFEMVQPFFCKSALTSRMISKKRRP